MQHLHYPEGFYRKSLFAVCLIFILTLPIFSVQAGQIIPLKGEKQQTTQILKSEPGKIVLEYSFTEIHSMEVKTKKGIFNEMFLTKGHSVGELGEPKLPAVKELLEIPFGAEVSVKILSYDTEEYLLSDYGIKNPIFPVQASVRKDQSIEELPFLYAEEKYTAKTYTNHETVQTEILGVLRGARIARLTLAPVQYNPAQNSITVKNNITVEISFDKADYALTQYIRESTFSPYFDGVYGKLLNGKTSKDVYEDNPDLLKYPTKMIIVSHRDFEESLEPFIEWKTKSGIEVILGYTDEIGTTPALIQEYIHGIYNAATPENPAPTFVIIAGDSDKVAASANISSNIPVTDLYYGSVDGDIFPEMYYGRLSARNVQEMNNQIEKILYYQKYEFENPEYLDDITLIAGSDGTWNPAVGQPTVNYGTQNYFNTSNGFSTVNAYLSSYTGCYDNQRISVSMINFTAHCSPTSWAGPNLSVNDVHNMTNTNKYPLAIGNCCQSARFSENESIGEAWVRAEKKGAVAYIGSVPNTYWFDDFYWAVGAFPISGNNSGYVPTTEETTIGAYDAPFTSDYWVLGSKMFVGNLAVTEADLQNYPTHSNPTYYWQAYHTFGDPSTNIFLTQGSENLISHIPVLHIGAQEFDVQADPGSYVAISKDGVLLGTAFVDNSGNAKVEITPVTSVGEVNVVVTRYKRIPYIETILATAPEGPYVVLDDFHVEGEKSLDYGQEKSITISLKNVGPDTAENVKLSLTSEDAHILDIIDASNIEFGSISSEQSVAIEDNFTITIAENTPDQHKARFLLQIEGAEDQQWESSFNLTVNAPVIEIDLDEIEDNGKLSFLSLPPAIAEAGSSYNYSIEASSSDGNSNGILDPGETAMLNILAKNMGHARANAVIFSLSSESQYAQIQTPAQTLTGLDLDESSLIPFSVKIDENTPLGTAIDFNFQWEYAGRTESQTINSAVGIQTENFDTGDFSGYPWQFAGFEDWIVQDVEVNSGEYAAKSGIITHNQSSEMEITLNVLTAGEISFFRKVSSESNYDFLHFYINNEVKGSWSGEVNWDEVRFDVSEGTNTFKWVYIKDGSLSTGSDCAWVDNIIWPPHTTGSKSDINITAIDLPTWLSLENKEDGTAKLSGTAPLEENIYTVKIKAERASEEIFQEFTITVMAAEEDDDSDNDDDDSTSTLAENAKPEIIVFPNPVKDNLSLEIRNTSQSLLITLSNYQGQILKTKEVNGMNNHLNMDFSGYARGIYYLRLDWDNQTEIRKIVK